MGELIYTTQQSKKKTNGSRLSFVQAAYGEVESRRSAAEVPGSHGPAQRHLRRRHHALGVDQPVHCIQVAITAGHPAVVIVELVISVVEDDVSKKMDDKMRASNEGHVSGCSPEVVVALGAVGAPVA